MQHEGQWLAAHKRETRTIFALLGFPTGRHLSTLQPNPHTCMVLYSNPSQSKLRANNFELNNFANKKIFTKREFALWLLILFISFSAILTSLHGCGASTGALSSWKLLNPHRCCWFIPSCNIVVQCVCQLFWPWAKYQRDWESFNHRDLERLWSVLLNDCSKNYIPLEKEFGMLK